MVRLGNDWDSILGDEFKKDYYIKLRSFLANEYRARVVFPDMFDIFNALRLTSFSCVRAVILGQDPYHDEGQANGLCFSVKRGIDLPPSLRNIYQELKADTGIEPPAHGDLSEWAKSGVLLLNNVLTVRAHEPNSHRGIGWEIFTERIIHELNQKTSPVVFMLWGANAQQRASAITNPQHLKLACAHPSPLSAYRGFFGCKHFSSANAFLESNNQAPVNWRLSD